MEGERYITEVEDRRHSDQYHHHPFNHHSYEDHQHHQLQQQQHDQHRPQSPFSFPPPPPPRNVNPHTGLPSLNSGPMSSALQHRGPGPSPYDRPPYSTSAIAAQSNAHNNNGGQQQQQQGSVSAAQHHRHRLSPPPIATLTQSPSLSASSSLDRASPPPHSHRRPSPPGRHNTGPYAYSASNGSNPQNPQQQQQQQQQQQGVPSERYAFDASRHHHSAYPGMPPQPGPYGMGGGGGGGGGAVMGAPPGMSGGGGGQLVYTDDASTKLNDRVRRRCFNCCTTDTSTWRRSNLHPGKVLCNKCGLFERTHSRPRPDQFPHRRGPISTSSSSGGGTPLSQPPLTTSPSVHYRGQIAKGLPPLGQGYGGGQQQGGGGGQLPPLAPHAGFQHPSLAPLMSSAGVNPNTGSPDMGRRQVHQQQQHQQQQQQPQQHQAQHQQQQQQPQQQVNGNQQDPHAHLSTPKAPSQSPKGSLAQIMSNHPTPAPQQPERTNSLASSDGGGGGGGMGEKELVGVERTGSRASAEGGWHTPPIGLVDIRQ